MHEFTISQRFLFIFLSLNLSLSSNLVSAAQHAIILQYHHVSTTTPTITSTKPELFKWQMDYLHKNGYVIWPISKVIKAIANKEELPDKCVAITFDDAYDSIYKTAYPIIKQYHWPFSIFVNTQAVGMNKHHLSWDDLRLMSQNNVEILNHSHSHTHFVRQKNNEDKSVWLSRIRDEIEVSQQLIIQNIGYAEKIIAYPYGEYSSDIINLIRELGYAGLGQQSGPVGYDMPLEIIPRYPMGANYGKESSFIQKLNTLPLPLIEYPVVDPIIGLDDDIPSLNLKFKVPSKEHLSKRKAFLRSLKKNFQCYVSGQSKAAISFIDDQFLDYQINFQAVQVQALKKLYVGRARYNCTISVRALYPHSKFEEPINNKTYFWYSQLWMTPKSNGEWYKE